MAPPVAAAPELQHSPRYSVSTEVFEGPFDLLLHLVSREQVDLYEVSLLRIVDAYLAHVAQLEQLDLEAATEFMVIAATLIELKSRRLLPDPGPADPDDDLDLWAERDVLIARLIECKTFKSAGAALEALADRAATSWPRQAGLEERFVSLVPDILAGVTPEDLRAALLRALAPAPPPPRIDLDHLAPIRLSVADAVEELMSQLAGRGPVSFRQLTAGDEDRLSVIVRFLAVLELYKDGTIEVDQAERYGDLRITWVGHDDPDDR